jgi:uncharacterized membrane protein YgcG
MSLDALIGFALVLIVAAFVVGAVVMRRQPHAGGRRDLGRAASPADTGYAPANSGYPASTTDARDQIDRDPRPNDPQPNDPGPDNQDAGTSGGADSSPGGGDSSSTGGDSGGGGDGGGGSSD